ncbi:MAG TPA: helix-turn-helix domain-containing protein, partial [Kofleriaceae bacterium]
LLLYPWEENLRYLMGVVHHAATEASEFPCSPEHLPPPLRAHRSVLRNGTGMPPDDPTLQQPTPQGAAPRQPDPTRDEIVEALRQTEGRMKPAAELLNVDRRKLYRLCDRFGIDFEDFRPAGLPREDE